MPTLSAKPTKSSLREDMLAKRAILPPQWVAQVSEEIIDHIRVHLADHMAKDIAFFFGVRNEPDLLPLAMELVDAGHRLCLPRAVDPAGPLLFNLWWPGEDMEEDRHGTPCASGEIMTPQLALVPLVAFDGAHHRLGYGGGYYDRTLAEYPDLHTVGVGYAFQQVENLPVEDHDRPLHAIVTENGAI